MKLKDILLERKDDVDRFKWLINREKLIGTNGSLYRGISGGRAKTDTFKQIKIRKDRRPRDTPMHVDAYIEGVRMGFYSDRPSRRSSAFVSQDKGVASVYGDLYYVMVPRKANIWTLDIDSFYLFDEDIKAAYSNLGAICDLFLDLQELSVDTPYEDLFTDLGDIFRVILHIDFDKYGEIEKLAARDHKYFLSNLPKLTDELYNAYYNSSSLSNDSQLYKLLTTLRNSKHGLDIIQVARAFYWLIQGVEKYYNSLKPFREGIDKNMEEVIVESDYYYVVNIGWYDENFGDL